MRPRPRIIEVVRRHPGKGVLASTSCAPAAAGRDLFIQFHLELQPTTSRLQEAHRISDAVEADLKGAFPGAEIIIHQDPSSAVVERAAGERGGEAPPR